MSKTCERHTNKPVIGYSSCVGCEFERIKSEAKDSRKRMVAENDALQEEVERLSQQFEQYKTQANKGWFELEQERDQLKAALHAVIEAAENLSFGLTHDEVENGESESTKYWFGRLQDALAATPEQSLADHDAEVIKRACAHVDDITYGHTVTQWFRDYANQIHQEAKEVQS